MTKASKANVKTETVAQVERRIRKILTGGVDRVQIIVGPYGVSASAIPSPHHPMVEDRRRQAYASHGGPTLSMDEATAINSASMGPVGRGHASDLVGALISLEADLAKYAKAKEPA